MNASRNYAIDALRTAGAFSVIVLHTHYDGFLTNKYVNLISLCARWAVPFFFLVSGYFFEQKSRHNLDGEFIKSLKYLVSIFIVSNIIYSLVALKTDYYTANDVLSIRSIILGSWFHLWFIGAMIFGYISLWFVLSAGLLRAMPFIAVAIAALGLLVGPYATFTGSTIDLYFSKFIISVPFLFAGFLYSKYRLQEKVKLGHSLVVLITGLVLQFTENYIIYSRSKPTLINHEYLFGTFLFAIGIFMISFSIPMKKDNLLSVVGRKYSLMIYLYHPLLILIVFFVIKKIGALNSYYILWFNPFSIFAGTLLAILVINKFYPKLFKIISGKVWA